VIDPRLDNIRQNAYAAKQHPRTLLRLTHNAFSTSLTGLAIAYSTSTGLAHEGRCRSLSATRVRTPIATKWRGRMKSAAHNALV